MRTGLLCEPPLRFHLDVGQLATTPPEARGIAPDGVRMLVATPDGLEHRIAADLPRVLWAGDVVVVNRSRTIPASVDGVIDGPARTPVQVHLSTVPESARVIPAQALAAGRSDWIVEVRRPAGIASEARYDDRRGAAIVLPAGGRIEIIESQPAGQAASRLWRAVVSTPGPLLDYLQAHGQPIRYGYVTSPWPIEDYRTDVGDLPGSVEMPSAARPLTPRLVDRLAVAGVQVARITLHCGVSSLESCDPPYAEWFDVPEQTAAEVSRARRDGRRVIAVGTTVVRALESAANDDGTVTAATGWTDLMVTPERGVSTVDGLLTGWHEPAATHLQMLQAVAGPDLLCASYAAALGAGYRWHEFGDVHLLLPRH